MQTARAIRMIARNGEFEGQSPSSQDDSAAATDRSIQNPL
jgi:hypothetical protein